MAFLAALGRAATPRTERLPWARATPRNLARAVVLGGRRLVELHDHSPVGTYQRTQAQP